MRYELKKQSTMITIHKKQNCSLSEKHLTSVLTHRWSDSYAKKMSQIDENKVDLTYDDIIELKSQNAIILVDVREREEIQETGKLPDSVNIPCEYFKLNTSQNAKI
jgi:hypothetical protein